VTCKTSKNFEVELLAKQQRNSKELLFADNQQVMKITGNRIQGI